MIENLKIEEYSYNDIASNTDLLFKLRQLTLGSYSGMNTELDQWQELVKVRRINANIFTANLDQIMVGWALLSKEPTVYIFDFLPEGYDGSQGILFEVYVSPTYRRKGVGSKLLEKAKTKVIGEKICVCPWDHKSHEFYDKFDKFNLKKV